MVARRGFYVSDGYNGTRVAKFDASGKFQFDFGKPGDSGKETRPGYMNNVHGVAVDLETRRVFVNDRDNHRIQIFDEKGAYLSEWRIAVSPSSLHFVQIGDDRAVVTFDRNTHKMLNTISMAVWLYDQEGTCRGRSRLRAVPRSSLPVRAPPPAYIKARRRSWQY